MTEQERNALREEIVENDKHARVNDDDMIVTRTIYGILQLNDVMMNLCTELRKALQGIDFWHRDIKNLCQRLAEAIHKNCVNKSKSGKAWGGVSSEHYEAIGMDNSILELLIKKFCGLTKKIAFFGGINASVGQKIWAVNPSTMRPILVRIDAATAKVECNGITQSVASVILHCTRLNNKLGTETRDRIDLDSMNFFDTKEQAVKWLEEHKQLKMA